MARQYFAFQVSGQKELSEALEQLPKVLADQVLRNTAKKALKPVADMARSMVTKEEEDLANSITVSTVLSKRQRRLFHKKGDVVAYVGPSHPKGAHGHLVEFGTRARYHKTTGKYVGIMPAQPFMRPAWDANKAKVLEIMQTEIWEMLKKAAQKLRKQAEKGTLSKSSSKFFKGF